MNHMPLHIIEELKECYLIRYQVAHEVVSWRISPIYYSYKPDNPYLAKLKTDIAVSGYLVIPSSVVKHPTVLSQSVICVFLSATCFFCERGQGLYSHTNQLGDQRTSIS